MVSFPPNSASKKKIQKTKSPCHRDSGLWTLSLARFIFCAMSSRGYCGPRVADLARRPRTQKYGARIMYIPKIKTLILPPPLVQSSKSDVQKFNIQVAPKSHEGGSTPPPSTNSSQGWSKLVKAGQPKVFRPPESRPFVSTIPFPFSPISQFGFRTCFGFRTWLFKRRLATILLKVCGNSIESGWQSLFGFVLSDQLLSCYKL